MIRAALIALALTGCASFNAPTREEAQAQRERDYSSAYGRFMDPRDPRLFAALNDEPECQQHANNAAHYLEQHGIDRSRMRVAFGDVIRCEGKCYHAVLLVDDYAVDNGGLSTWCPERVCRVDEALLGMRNVIVVDMDRAERIAALQARP